MFTHTRNKDGSPLQNFLYSSLKISEKPNVIRLLFKCLRRLDLLKSGNNDVQVFVLPHPPEVDQPVSHLPALFLPEQTRTCGSPWANTKLRLQNFSPKKVCITYSFVSWTNQILALMETLIRFSLNVGLRDSQSYGYKYIELESGSWFLAQFGSGSSSGEFVFNLTPFASNSTFFTSVDPDQYLEPQSCWILVRTQCCKAGAAGAKFILGIRSGTI